MAKIFGLVSRRNHKTWTPSMLPLQTCNFARAHVNTVCFCVCNEVRQSCVKLLPYWNACKVDMWMPLDYAFRTSLSVAPQDFGSVDFL
jgi:hypothetical protein